jgi:uncharacterized protein YjbI with pentapeptide repeats
MFVAIENNDKNIPQITEWIIKTRDANGGVISPEFAMEILSKTNHFGHIKMVLKNINDKCSDDEKKKYKDFVLACVDGREMSPQAMEGLRELADVCGVRDKLDTLDCNSKFYNKYDCDIFVVTSTEEIEALNGENLTVYYDSYRADLIDIDLSKVRSLKLKKASTGLFRGAKNFPKDLDVSVCKEVYLNGLDLEGRPFNFGKESVAVFEGSCNIQRELDLSNCSEVDFNWCSLSGVENIKFSEGAIVDFSGAKNLPKNLDVSMCSSVKFKSCNLEGINLKFREGAEVWLSGAKNLPEELDLSMCSYVTLVGCDLSSVKSVKFKNKEQEMEFLMRASCNFSGKVIYAGDKNQNVMCYEVGGVEI